MQNKRRIQESKKGSDQESKEIKGRGREKGEFV